MEDLKDVTQMHELLMRFKPSEASHDVSLCPICDTAEDGSAAHNDDTPLGGGDMSNKTYTDEDLQALLGPVQEELATLKASQDQAAIEARIEELTTKHQDELAELQDKVDSAAAEAEASKNAHDELVAYLDEEGARAVAEAALVARRDEVKAAVAGTFSEEHIEENLDRWASLDAEVFEAMLIDWKAAATAAVAVTPDEDKKDEKPIASSAMTASADDSHEPANMSDLRRNLLRDPSAVKSVGATR